MASLIVGGRDMDESDAWETIREYAFGEEPLGFSSTPPSYGPAPRASTRARWAYRVYDCVPADPSPNLTIADILVAAGINAGLSVKSISGALAVSAEVSEALSAIPEGRTFWKLDRNHLATGSEPPQDSAEWLALRAWWLLEAVPGIGVAIAHKILHHKRPKLFPILDGETLGQLRSGGSWVQIHEELEAGEEVFSRLESRFVEEIAQHSTVPSAVPLYRLRMHDILLWCQAMGGCHGG